MTVDEINDLFRDYHNNHRNMVDKKFRENGLYFGQPPILKYLSMNDNATQKEIADHLHISPPSVAVSVKRMEETGLIMRVVDSSDARRKNLKLTEKGEKLLELADNYFVRADRAVYNGFSDSELDILGDFLNRMNKNILEFAKEEQNA